MIFSRQSSKLISRNIRTSHNSLESSVCMPFFSWPETVDLGFIERRGMRKNGNGPCRLVGVERLFHSCIPWVPCETLIANAEVWAVCAGSKKRSETVPC